MKPIRVGTNKLHLEYNAGPNKWGINEMKFMIGHQHTSMMVEKDHYTLSYMPEREWPTMAERAEKLAAQLDIERKLQFYENWAEAVINNYFVFSDGSEIEVPVK